MTAQNEIIEFSCMYTPDVTQKRKKWHDGFLKWHTFNSHALLYSQERQQVDCKFFPNKKITSDMELSFARNLVSIGDMLVTTHANLENIIRQPTETPAKGALVHARHLMSSVQRSGAYKAPTRTPTGIAQTKRIYPSCASQTPLHARHIVMTPKEMVSVQKAVQTPLPGKRKLDNMLNKKATLVPEPESPAMVLPLSRSTKTNRSSLGTVSKRVQSDQSASPEPVDHLLPETVVKAAKTSKASIKQSLINQAESSKQPSGPKTPRPPVQATLQTSKQSVGDSQCPILVSTGESPPRTTIKTLQRKEPAPRIVSLKRKERGLLSTRSRVARPKPSESPGRDRSSSPECIEIVAPVPPPRRMKKAQSRSESTERPISALSKVAQGLRTAAERDEDRRANRLRMMEDALLKQQREGRLAEAEQVAVDEDDDDAFEKAWQAHERAMEVSHELHPAPMSERARCGQSAATAVDKEMASAPGLDAAWGMSEQRSDGFKDLIDELLSSQSGPTQDKRAEASVLAHEPEPNHMQAPTEDIDLCPATPLLWPCSRSPIDELHKVQTPEERDTEEMVMATPKAVAISKEPCNQEQFMHLLALPPRSSPQRPSVTEDADGFTAPVKPKTRRKLSKGQIRITMPIVAEPDEQTVGKLDHLLASFQLSQAPATPPIDDGWQLPLATAPVAAHTMQEETADTDEDEVDTTQERHLQQHLDAAARRIAANSTLSRLNPQRQRGLARTKGPSLHKIVALVQQPQTLQQTASAPSLVMPRANATEALKRHPIVIEQTVATTKSGVLVPHRIIKRSTASSPARAPKRVLQDTSASCVNQAAEALPIAKRPTGLSRQNSLQKRPGPVKAPSVVNQQRHNHGSFSEDGEAGMRLATQLAVRAPDFMSAKSLNAGAILGLDAPIAGLQGMSARELVKGIGEFSQNPDEL